MPVQIPDFIVVYYRGVGSGADGASIQTAEWYRPADNDGWPAISRPAGFATTTHTSSTTEYELHFALFGYIVGPLQVDPSPLSSNLPDVVSFYISDGVGIKFPPTPGI